MEVQVAGQLLSHMTAHLEPQPPTAAESKLAAYEMLCSRLWPYIRFWGLCGAAPEAIGLMVELGRLIGEVQDERESTPNVVAAPISPAALAAAQESTRKAVIEHVASWFENSHFRRKMVRSDAAALIAAMRSL